MNRASRGLSGRSGFAEPSPKSSDALGAHDPVHQLRIVGVLLRGRNRKLTWSSDQTETAPPTLHFFRGK